MRAITARWTRIGNGLFIQYIDSNGKLKLKEPGFDPYFFVLENKVGNASLDIDRWDDVKNKKVRTSAQVVEGDFYTLTGDKCVKIKTGFPHEVPNIRERFERQGIKTYESDILFAKRWRLDNAVGLPEYPRKLYMDIEVDSSEGFADPHEASSRVLSIAAVDEDGNEYFFADEDEKALLKEFRNFINNFTVIIGWNLIGYDYRYLRNRIYNIFTQDEAKKFRWGSLHEWVDLMRLYKFLKPHAPSFALDDVGEEELGIGKTEDFWKLKKAGELAHAFKNDLDFLRKYNIRDCHLVRQLDEKFRLVRAVIRCINAWGTMSLDDFQFLSSGIGSLILAEAQKIKPRTVFPKEKRGQKKEGSQYEGAYILDPDVGFHKSVVEFDFAQFYPSIIETFRISPENIAHKSTGDEVTTARSDIRFRKGERQPIYSKILNRITGRRDELAELQAFDHDKIVDVEHRMCKMYGVSFYGTQGYTGARMFHKPLAESITLTAQDVLKQLNEFADNYDYKARYAHTDGSYLNHSSNPAPRWHIFNAPPVVEQLNADLKKWAIENYNVDPKDYTIRLELKRVFEWLYLFKKNRLYGHVMWDGNNVVDEDYHKGLEKSDVFEFLNTVRRGVLKILSEAPDSQKLFERRLRDYLEDMKKRLFEGEFDEQLITKKHATKPLDEYKVTSPHVRAAKILDEKDLFRVGDQVSYVIVGLHRKGEVKGLIKPEPVIDEIPRINRKGYNYYWNRVDKFVKELLGYDMNIDPWTRKLDEFMAGWERETVHE